MKKLFVLLSSMVAVAAILAVSCKKEAPNPYATPDDTFITYWEALKSGDAEAAVNCLYLEDESQRASMVEAYQNKVDSEVWSNVSSYKREATSYLGKNEEATIAYQLIDKEGKLSEDKYTMSFKNVDGKWLIKTVK